MSSFDDDADSVEIISENEQEEEDNGETSFDDEEVKFTEECEVCSELTKNVLEINRRHKATERQYSIPAALIEHSFELEVEEQCAVRLTFDVGTLPEGTRFAWELAEVSTITLCLSKIHKANFRRMHAKPRIFTYRDFEETPSNFVVGTALKNTAINYLEISYTVNDNEPEDPTYFLGLYEFLRSRLSTLSEFCFICSNPLSRPGFMLSLCDSELCTYQYDELDMFADASLVPRVSAEVLALLLFAFFNASKARKPDIAFQPAPKIRNEGAFVEDLLKMDKNAIGTDFKKLNNFGTTEYQMKKAWEVLEQNLQCPMELFQSSESYGIFRNNYKEIARLVEWIIVSNTAYIEHLGGAEIIDHFRTPHQFLFVNDSKAKAAEFSELVNRNKGRTKLLFHGSPTENWHSIIRRGLKNMSGTRGQLNGAAYGAGIYMSGLLQTSMGYAYSTSSLYRKACADKKGCCYSSAAPMKNMDRDRFSHMGTGYSIVAVVEVVDTPEAFAHRPDDENIVVVKDEKWCTIRMLLLFDSASSQRSVSPNVSLSKAPASVFNAIKEARMRRFHEPTR